MSGGWIALIAVGAAAASAFGYFLYRSVKQKRAQIERFLAAPEPQYKSFSKPRPFEYSSECERIINKKFADYVDLCNEYIKYKGKLEYLNKKKLAEHYTARDTEALTDDEIKKYDTALENCRAAIERSHWFNYSAKDAAGNVEMLFMDYAELASLLPTDKLPPEPMKSFAPKGKRWLQCSEDVWMMLTEFYILVYNNKDMSIRIYDYSELSVTSDFKVKSLGFGVAPDENDEIAAKHWKHETKDGKQDKKYQNNPIRVEVFRGFVVFSVGKIKAKADFQNKKFAVLTEKRVNSYKKTVASKPIQRYVNYLYSSDVLSFRVSDMEKRMPTDEEIKQAQRIEREEERARLREERERAKAEERAEKKAERERERAEAKASGTADSTVIATESTSKKSSTESILDTLTKDEIELIKKNRKAKNEAEKAAEREQAESERRAAMRALPEAPITQLTGTRVISNNLFSFNYQINEGYEYKGVSLKLVDWVGKDVSTVYNIEPVSPGTRIRASFELLSGRNYNSEVPYYMLLTPTGADAPIGKLEYKIKISFTTDYDF